MSGASDGEGPTILRAVFRKLEQIQAEQQRQHTQGEDTRRLLLAQVEQGRRIERHLSELRDELELMIKAELMGQLGMMRTEMGHRFDELADRITVLEGGDPWQVGADSKPD